METPLQVLTIQENPMDIEKLAHILRQGGYSAEFHTVDNEPALLGALNKKDWDVIIADDEEGLFNAGKALPIIRKNNTDIPFIVVSSKGGEENAVSAMRDGAHDYVLKSNLVRLVPAIEREMREAGIRAARRRADETVNHLCHHDSLTGLPNRTVLYDCLQRKISVNSRLQIPVALLIMDLDGFKKINDTLGHYYGDLLLQQLAQRLKLLSPNLCTVARMGGDEFAVLQDASDVNAAVNCAQQLLKTLETPFILKDENIIIGASIGIAMYPEHGVNADALIQCADVAMYAAKNAKSDYAVYDGLQNHNEAKRLALLDDFRAAITTDQLVLYYQPKIDLKSRHIIGVEALVRWPHPQMGILKPADFIPGAEHTHLIRLLSLWVLNKSLHQLSEWQRAGYDFNLSVNLPVRSLHDAKLPNQISDLLTTHSINAKYLELEITERTLMVDLLNAMDAMKKLAQLGVSFSIDDFGTGHFSLRYLKNLPVSLLKIDKSFILNMPQSRDDEDIVRASIGLAHNMGLTVLAEGVENRDIWDLLVVHGCDCVQGNLISVPLPADEFTQWLKHSPWSLERKVKIG